MTSWKAAYARCRESERFRAYFGRQGRIPTENDFEGRAFNLAFENLTPAESPGTPGAVMGPLTQEFARGAVILGVSAASFMAQQTEGSIADYTPSRSSGRRDLFVLYMERTGGEPITMEQNVLTATTATLFNEARVMADALMGSGLSDVFSEEIIIAPSNSLSVSCASLVAAAYEEVLPTLTVHVCFHAMVPKEAW